MLRASDCRAGARRALYGHWKVAILAGILVAFVTNGTVAGLGLEVDFDRSGLGLIACVDLPPVICSDEYISLAEVWLPIGIGAAIVLALAYAVLIILIGSPLSVGHASFHLSMIDGSDPQLGELFSHYGRMKTIVWTDVLRGLHIIGGTLLFIIPGIIASYSYRLTDYLLAEHPELAPKEVLERSNQMMEGNRWRLFCLDLSFLGWGLLSMFTLGIGNLWLNPYREAAYAMFYRNLTQTVETISVIE